MVLYIRKRDYFVYSHCDRICVFFLPIILIKKENFYEEKVYVDLETEIDISFVKSNCIFLDPEFTIPLLINKKYTYY